MTHPQAAHRHNLPSPRRHRELNIHWFAKSQLVDKGHLECAAQLEDGQILFDIRLLTTPTIRHPRLALRSQRRPFVFSGGVDDLSVGGKKPAPTRMELTGNPELS